MIRFYLIAVLKNLRQNLVNKLINLSGLVIGISVVLLTSAWILDEFKYEKFNTNYRNIFRLLNTDDDGSQDVIHSFLLRDVLIDNIPELENTVRLDYDPEYKFILEVDNQIYQQDCFSRSSLGNDGNILSLIALIGGSGGLYNCK